MDNAADITDQEPLTRVGRSDLLKMITRLRADRDRLRKVLAEQTAIVTTQRDEIKKLRKENKQLIEELKKDE